MKKIKKIIISFLMAFLAVTSAMAESAYFTGDGGKDISISVEKPKVQNVGEDVAWLPDYANNVISNNIKKYSAITVVEKRYENAVSSELAKEEGGSYAEGGAEAGQFRAAKNQLQVSIIGKGTSYNVSASVVDKTTLESKASFNEDCNYASLESGSVLNKAVESILVSLGVELTQKAKDELKIATEKTGDNRSIEAQKLVAKAEQAENSGDNVGALRLAMEASRKDANLTRANTTKNRVSTAVQSGDFGAKARDAIQRRKDFVSLLEETKAYYIENPPFTFVYDPNLIEGNIDYKTEMFGLSFKAAMVANTNLIDDYYMIKSALQANPEYKDWGISAKSMLTDAALCVTISFVNNKGNAVATKDYFIYIYNFAYEVRTVDTETFKIEIPSSADTDGLYIKIDKVAWGYDRYNHKKIYNENRTSSDDSIGILPKDDYLNDVIIPNLKPVDTGVNNVYLIGCSITGYSYLKDHFKYPDLLELAKAKFKIVKEDDIVLTSEEKDRIYEKTRNNDSIIRNSYYVTNEQAPYPRLKSEFLKNPLTYLNFEYRILGDSGSSFVVINKAQEKLLCAVLGTRSLSGSSTTYYYTENDYSWGDILAGNTENYVTRSVSIYNFKDMLSVFNGWEMYEIPTTNKYYYDGQTSYHNRYYMPELYEFIMYYDRIGATKRNSTVYLGDDESKNDYASIVLPYYFKTGHDPASSIRISNAKQAAGKLGFTCGFYSTNDNKNPIVLSIIGTVKSKWEGVAEINIPSEINGIPVVKIEKNALCNISSMQSVTISQSIQEIEKEAFSGCSSLKNVIIPNSDTKIKWGFNVFKGCPLSEESKASLRAAGYKGKEVQEAKQKNN